MTKAVAPDRDARPPAKALAQSRLRTKRGTTLLDAAARLFRAKGFEGTTVRDIAREAGMLPGSVHYRYTTKESLLLALMERAVAAAVEAVRAAASRSLDPVERVRLGLRAHLKLLLSGDDAVYVLLYDWRSLKGEARASMVRMRDRYESFWDGMLYEAAGSGRLRPGVDLRLVRLFGFGAVNWAAQWYTPRGGRRPEEIADAFWAYMALGVLDDAHRPRDVQGARPHEKALAQSRLRTRRGALAALSALEPRAGRRS